MEREPLFIWFGDILAITSGTNKLEIISRWELYKTCLFKSCTIFFSDSQLECKQNAYEKKKIYFQGCREVFPEL